MRQAANESTTTSLRALVGLTAAIACAALPAGCSTSASRSAGHVGTTASTTTTTTTTTPLITYQVKRGDRLATIANRFRVSIAAIVFVNHVADPNRLTEGQVLLIPPTPPLMLVVTPSEGQPGRAFQLNLTGANPSELITFEIDSPTGKYTGRAHLASADGVVTATYQTSLVDPIGTYKVIANGHQGTTAQASFRVVTASTGHT
jgi:LysM repeat protein